MLKEVGGILFSVITQGLDLASRQRGALQNAFETLMSIYVGELDVAFFAYSGKLYMIELSSNLEIWNDFRL